MSARFSEPPNRLSMGTLAPSAVTLTMPPASACTLMLFATLSPTTVSVPALRNVVTAGVVRSSRRSTRRLGADICNLLVEEGTNGARDNSAQEARLRRTPRGIYRVEHPTAPHGAGRRGRAAPRLGRG